MKRKLFCLLLICLFVSTVGLAFHHHKDGTAHDNCVICSFVSHPASFVLQETPQISAPSSSVLLIFLEDEDIVSHPNYHPYLNRAPPAYGIRPEFNSSMCTGPCDVILSLFCLVEGCMAGV